MQNNVVTLKVETRVTKLEKKKTWTPNNNKKLIDRYIFLDGGRALKLHASVTSYTMASNKYEKCQMRLHSIASPVLRSLKNSSMQEARTTTNNNMMLEKLKSSKLPAMSVGFWCVLDIAMDLWDLSGIRLHHLLAYKFFFLVAWYEFWYPNTNLQEAVLRSLKH